MKRSAKANAITNSPFVRALIQPVLRRIVPAPALPPPSQADLIPTQPAEAPRPVLVPDPVGVDQVGPAAVALASEGVVAAGVSAKAAGKKRAREVEVDEAEAEAEDGKGAVGEEGAEVVVRYTKENLPAELNKCENPCTVLLFSRSTGYRCLNTPYPPLPCRRPQTGTSATGCSRATTTVARWTRKAGTRLHPRVSPPRSLRGVSIRLSLFPR